MYTLFNADVYRNGMASRTPTWSRTPDVFNGFTRPQLSHQFKNRFVLNFDDIPTSMLIH